MSEYNEEIVSAAKFYNVKPAWIKAVIHIESNWDAAPRPRWEPHISEHSYGLGQFLPSTALWILRTPSKFPMLPGIRAKLQEAQARLPQAGESSINTALHDPEVAIHLIAAYLRYQLDRYGNITDAVAAYNAGSPRHRSTGEYVNQWHVDKFTEALAIYS